MKPVVSIRYESGRMIKILDLQPDVGDLNAIVRLDESKMREIHGLLSELFGPIPKQIVEQAALW